MGKGRTEAAPRNDGIQRVESGHSSSVQPAAPEAPPPIGRRLAPRPAQRLAAGNDLCAQLRERLTGRVCWLGLGNDELGDDGFGLRLAAALREAGHAHAHAVGAVPERWLSSNELAGVDNLVFLDAVEFGGEPGSVVFLDAGQLRARFPQVSTHKLSLGLLAEWAEANGQTKAWLLGVQPGSVRPRKGLTPEVELSLRLLKEVICGSLEEGMVD